MPLKIKLPRSNLDPSGANSSRNQEASSSFPLPPNNVEVASDAPVRTELTVAATNFDTNDGNNQQISHVSVGVLHPNHQQTMLQPPPPPPTGFDFSSNNNNYQAAATNEPPTQHNWQHEQMQQETTQVVMNPMEITNQVGYKDFLPPPTHELKNSTEKGSSGNNNIMSNDSSNFVPQMNDHDLATSIDGKSINYNNFYQNQPQQHPLIPPLPLQHEGMENTSYENENESDQVMMDGNSKTDGTTEMVYQEQGQNNIIIPIYAYSTLHQQKSWNEMIDLFTRFTEVNGHSDVEMDNVKLLMNDKNSNNDSGDNDSEEEETLLMLRSWVRELRYIRNAHGSGEGVEKKNSTKLSTRQQQQRCDSETLTLDRISQLNQLSFPWKIYDTDDDNNNSQWQKWIDDFLHYRSKNGGDGNVPLKLQENPSLGNFVIRQRVEYRKMMNGKPTTMSNTKVQELERVGFIFSVREGGHTSWDDRFAELVAYQREHGDTLVPKKYPPNPSLGYWVNEQRSQYQRAINGKSSTMDKKRQEKLNAINFKWSIREPSREFAEWIKLLKLYKSQWGDCNVPLKYKQDLSLGSFVNNARTQYKKFQSGLSSNMTQEKIDQLEEIGFVWNIRQRQNSMDDKIRGAHSI